MSDLQLALILLGAVIIAAVAGYNWWQERRFRDEASRQFQHPQHDALMDNDFHFDAAAILKDDDANSPQYQSYNGNQDERDEQPGHAEPSLTPPDYSSSPYGIEVEHLEVPADEPEAIWQAIDHETDVQERDSSHVADADDQLLQPEGATDYSRNFQEEIAEHAVADEAAAGYAREPAAGFAQADDVPDPSEQTALSTNIDERIDLIAVLYLPKPVSGIKLRDFLLSVTDIDKPKFLHGLNGQGIWQEVTRELDAEEFSKATCSIQLADRSGFVSRNALNRFQHEVERVALKLGAQVEWQKNGDAWHYASELDQFCIQVDKMVGFHLVQGENGPFTGTKFRGLAEANGMTLGEDGAFHSLNEQGYRLYSVVNVDNNPFSLEMLRTSVIHGVTFQLDIPRVTSCLEAFNQMVLTARQMENSLGAVLVDDNQRPIGETQIEKIRHQLKVIHAKMVTRGIIPGSPIALRLFS
ncbi:hypothetical protein MTYP_01069 [Methylophilaceae bacterium]|nr:hypothetical protein MTYP_01069 [Methylophilaceae bacterium]